MATITVQVWDVTGNKKNEVELPDDEPVNRILEVLIDRMNLPRIGCEAFLPGPGGTPLSRPGWHARRLPALQEDLGPGIRRLEAHRRVAGILASRQDL
jgi:hypothetical protein